MIAPVAPPSDGALFGPGAACDRQRCDQCNKQISHSILQRLRCVTTPLAAMFRTRVSLPLEGRWPHSRRVCRCRSLPSSVGYAIRRCAQTARPGPAASQRPAYAVLLLFHPHLNSLRELTPLPSRGREPARFIVATPAFASGFCQRTLLACDKEKSRSGARDRASLILIRGAVFRAPPAFLPRRQDGRPLRLRCLGQGPDLWAHHPAASPLLPPTQRRLPATRIRFMTRVPARAMGPSIAYGRIRVSKVAPIFLRMAQRFISPLAGEKAISMV